MTGSQHTVQVAMNKMGNKLREDELHALIADADVDGNGTIDYEEFVAATVNLNKLEKEEHCMQVYSKLLCSDLLQAPTNYAQCIVQPTTIVLACIPYLMQYPYDPGILLRSANLYVLGKSYLRFNLLAMARVFCCTKESQQMHRGSLCIP